MASDHADDSLLSGVQQVFPVSVHASRSGNEEPTTPEDSGDPGRGLGYSLRQDRKRSFTEFDATDSDQYPYSEEDSSTPQQPQTVRHQLLDFPVLSDGKTTAKTRVRNWTHPETETLLAIWGHEEVQAQLKNSVHNNWIWERISVLIGQRHPEFQPSRTAAQCKERLTYLRKQYRKAARLRARGKWPNVGNIQIYLDKIHAILAKRPSGNVKQAASSASAPSTSKPVTSGAAPPSTTAQDLATSQPAGTPVPTLPDVPESEDDDDEEDEDDEGDLDETEGDDIQDLFGQIQGQDAEPEMDISGEMPENNGNKTTEPVFTAFNPTVAAKTNKRPSSSQQYPKRPRGRQKARAPPRDDLTVAQAITDAMMRFIDHQSFHLTEQTKLLQRYLKFERARMRWEMDMETRRMKWEEEREMREEERRQRQEDLQSKRVSDNREFMLQMAVVLGNGAASSKDNDSTKNL